MEITFETSERAVQEIIWGIRRQATLNDDPMMNDEVSQELRAVAADIEGQLDN